MTTPERSSLARQRLSGGLRKLRNEAGKPGTAVARATGMSQSKLSKIENGVFLPSVTDVERLVAELSAPPQVSRELMALADRLQAEVETRRVVLHRGPHRQHRTLSRIEAEATTSLYFENASVPTLLRSEDYLRLVLQTAPPDEQDAAIAALHERRARMEDRAKRFVFLLWEGALRWRMGSGELMRHQIEHLTEIARRPNVRLGVIPWNAEATTLALHGFQVYDARVVTLSVLTGNATITDPYDVHEYLALFTQLEQLAVHGEALEHVLDNISRGHCEPALPSPHRLSQDRMTAPPQTPTHSNRGKNTTKIEANSRTTVTGAARDELAARLTKKYEQGASIRALAESTRRSYGFVHRLLTESGVELRGQGSSRAAKR